MSTVRNSECECGDPATVPSMGRLVCARCKEMEKPHQTHKKLSGIRAMKGWGANLLNWDTHRIGDDFDKPIVVPLATRERMLQDNLAKAA